MHLDLLRRRFAEQARPRSGSSPATSRSAPPSCWACRSRPSPCCAIRSSARCRPARHAGARSRSAAASRWRRSTPTRSSSACLIQNHMVKMLALTPEEMTDGVPHRARPRRRPPRAGQAEPGRAHRRLGRAGALRGVLRRAGAAVRLGPGPAAVRQPEHAATTPSDGLRERIAEDNQLDIELYRFALELREQRSAARVDREGRRHGDRTARGQAADRGPAPPGRPTGRRCSTLLAASLGWSSDDHYEAFFDWKHEQNPFGRSPAWVAVDGGEVVGFRTFLRWEHRHPTGRGAAGGAGGRHRHPPEPPGPRHLPAADAAGPRRPAGAGGRRSSSTRPTTRAGPAT